MSKSGKISPIKKEYPSTNLQTMQSSLSAKGLSRVPGTGVFKYPYKELNGQYRTGLDPNASYIKRIADETERQIEIDRVKKLKKELEAELDMDLSPNSKFWNHALSTSPDDSTHVQPVKLLDEDNFFDFEQPMKKLAFAWLRVHPTIASSLEAYHRGDYPADTQFYVVDDEFENKAMYNKKQLINKAIVKFENMSNEKRKKVARMLGLPVTDDTSDDAVYNLVDNQLKQTEFTSGKHQGLNPVEVFTRFADMKDKLLHVNDLIKQAFTYSIYRTRTNGKIFEGEVEVATDEQELAKYLVDDDHQEDLIRLEQLLKNKKLKKS